MVVYHQVILHAISGIRWDTNGESLPIGPRSPLSFTSEQFGIFFRLMEGLVGLLSVKVHF